MEQVTIRIGIVGCANIARKVARAIVLAPNTELTAVASRSLEKATDFAKANNFPPTAKIYGSYESLLDDSDIDAVYLPLPTSLHLKYACLAANKKKHILLEKPVAMNVAEFDDIVTACVANGVQIMDCTMWMHHPRTEKMLQFLSDKDRFGDIKSIDSCFSYSMGDDCLANDIRTKPNLDGLGALGDAGWYSIRAILWATGYELPKTVVAMHGPELNKDDVILSCGGALYWEDGRSAVFRCSFLSHMAMDISVIGSAGSLHVHDFVIPVEENKATFLAASRCTFNKLSTGWGLHPSEHALQTSLPQEACMVREFASLVANIKSHGAQPDQSWPARSRKTMLVIDAINASIAAGFVPVAVPS